MATIYHFQTERRRNELRRSREADRRHDREGSPVLETSTPTVEFGSGWYHDEAITRSHDITSHRCL